MSTSKTWKSSFKIIIIGCGIGGLTAAISARQAGYSVAILEQAPELREVGAGIQLPANAACILKQWSLLPAAAACSIQPRNMRWRSYRTGNIIGTSNHHPLTEQKFGLPHFVIHRWDYQALLHDEVIRLGVKLELGVKVTGFCFHSSCSGDGARDDSTSAIIQLSNGETRTANLILGADGGMSVCRPAVVKSHGGSGNDSNLKRAGEIAIRITASAETIRRNPATASLLLEGEQLNMDIWLGPQSHVITYLLARGDVLNMVLTQNDEDSGDVFDSRLKQVTIESVREFFAEWDPQLRAILDVADVAAQSVLGRIEEVDEWVHKSGKMVLLGDAVHPMLPYLAQGAAQAVEDAALFGTLLDECTSSTEIPDVLSIYQRERKPRVSLVRDLSQGMKFTNSLPNGPEQRDRDRRIAEGVSDEHPVPYANSRYQDWLWGYDAIAEGRRAWRNFVERRGKNPIELVEAKESKSQKGKRGIEKAKL